MLLYMPLEEFQVKEQGDYLFMEEEFFYQRIKILISYFLFIFLFLKGIKLMLLSNYVNQLLSSIFQVITEIFLIMNI